MIDFLRRWFRKPRPDLVPYYDFATKTTARIPRAELRPGVVLIQIEGQDEAVYADSAELKMGVHQHAALGEELREAIRTLTADLADVYPQSFEQWEDGFRRDRTPEREIAGWLHLSAILQVLAKRYGFEPAEKKECFRVLVACFTGARDTVRDRSDPKLLSNVQVDQAIKYFYEGGYE